MHSKVAGFEEAHGELQVHPAKKIIRAHNITERRERHPKYLLERTFNKTGAAP